MTRPLVAVWVDHEKTPDGYFRASVSAYDLAGELLKEITGVTSRTLDGVVAAACETVAEALRRNAVSERIRGEVLR